MALIDKLKNIANAVRTKTNKTGLLTLDDLTNEISKIPDFDMFINMSIEEITSNTTSLKKFAFCGCQKLKYACFPELLLVNSNSFEGCISLQTVIIPKVIEIYGGAFSKCESLERIELNHLNFMEGNAFGSCTNLKTVIINAQNGFIRFGSDIFFNTPIASGTGYIYFPDELVEGFKTNASLKKYANQIKPISELEV